MGIKGLWNHLPKTKTGESLLDFTLTHGFEANPNGHRAYRIGIDVASWFYHAQKAMSQTRNGELQMFFHRCCRLLSVPALALFVFDGPQRPAFKRNKEIRVIENTQLNELRELIAAFGFECVTAPGEAEAALAQLNAAGVIDAILSDDGDCFLFGAKTVLRSVKDTEKSKYMEHFDVYTIQDLERSAFSRDELLLIALLRGGDYDPGLSGCGITTAVNLRQLKLGKQLVENWNKRNSSLNSWSNSLSLWRAKLKTELLLNISGESGQVNTKAANNITGTFPNDEVVSAYLDPVIFSPRELDHVSKNVWKSELSLQKLSAFCLNRFQWGTNTKILETFRNLVWSGTVMQMLLRIVRNNDQGILIELPFELKAVKQKPKMSALIQLSIKPFIREVKEGIYNARPTNEDTIVFPWRLMQKDKAVLANKDNAEDILQCFRIPYSIVSMICPLLLPYPADKGSLTETNLKPDHSEAIYISSDSD